MKKILVILSFITLLSCGIKDDTNKGNRLIVTQDKYYIYYDNEVIELNKGTYITKENKIDDYFFDFKFVGKQLKDEKKLLSDLSKYFPHGIGEVAKGVAPKNAITLPIYDISGKKIIDSVKLANLLDGESQINSETNELEAKTQIEEELVDLSNKKVEILNANGISGFAKKIGESLKNSLNMEYNAENYHTNSNFTFVVNHKLSDKELETFVNSLNIKYVKILKDDNLKPESDVVLVTGNDSLVNYPITLITNNEQTELKNTLSSYKITIKKENNIAEGTIIKYRSEDEFIAKKIATLLENAKLEKDDTIKEGLIIQSSR